MDVSFHGFFVPSVDFSYHSYTMDFSYHPRTFRTVVGILLVSVLFIPVFLSRSDVAVAAFLAAIKFAVAANNA